MSLDTTKSLPDSSNLAKPPAEPRLLYSNPDFLVFDKPQGVSFYEDGNKHDLLKAVRKMQEDGRIPDGDRLFPVHRLDKVTSGLLLFARGRANANHLGNEFRFNRVNKIYIALSLHPPKKRHGFVEGDIVKSRRGSYKLSRDSHATTRTFYTSRSIPNRRPGLRLFLVKPETGKTHQIRVVLKSIGSPILGDWLYDRFDTARIEERTYLHAAAISFQLKGKTHRFVELPGDGAEYLSSDFKDTLTSFGDLFKVDWPAATPNHHSIHASFSDHSQHQKQSKAKNNRPGRRERRSRKP